MRACVASGSSTVIRDFQLSDIIPSAEELHSYYRYVGSMTTPGCEQAVAWTVFHKTLSISSQQVTERLDQVRNSWGEYLNLNEENFKLRAVNSSWLCLAFSDQPVRPVTF